MTCDSRPTLVIIGAYGSGKTECALALAQAWASREPVTLVDLDFATPYFRVQDHRDMLAAQGITLVAPGARVGQIDAPAMPPDARAALTRPAGRTIVDLGGDPVGAVVIAQFAPDMQDYDCWAVVNFFRPATPTPPQAAVLLREIACAARLRLTGLISNSHLGTFTTGAEIEEGLKQARVTAALLGVPVVCVGTPAWVSETPAEIPILSITPRLQRPWER